MIDRHVMSEMLRQGVWISAQVYYVVMQRQQSNRRPLNSQCVALSNGYKYDITDVSLVRAGIIACRILVNTSLTVIMRPFPTRSHYTASVCLSHARR